MAPSLFGRKKMPSPSPHSTSPDPVDLFPAPSQRKLTRMNSNNRSPTPVGLGLSRSDSMSNGEFRQKVHHLRNVSSVEDNRFEYSHRQRTAPAAGGGTSLTASSLRMIQNMPRPAPRTPVTVEESESEHYFDTRVDQERDTYRSTSRTRNHRQDPSHGPGHSVSRSVSSQSSGPPQKVQSPGMYSISDAQIRIQELEAQNGQLEADLAHKTNVLNTIRENPVLAQKEQESTSALLRQKRDLQTLLEARTTQLTSLQSSHSGLLNRVASLESTLATKSSETNKLQNRLSEFQAREQIANTIEGLGLADMGRRLVDEIRLRQESTAARDAAISKTQGDLEALRSQHATQLSVIQQKAAEDMARAMANEEQKRINLHKKSREDAAFIMAEEEKKRVDLTKNMNAKLANLEQQRAVDLEDAERQHTLLKREITALEHQLSEATTTIYHKETSLETLSNGNADLIALVKKLTIRLAEEKKKTRHLMEVANSTSPHAATISSAIYPEDLTQQLSTLESHLGDRDAKIARLESSLAASKRERNDFETAWARATSDLAHLQQELATMREISLGGAKTQSPPPPELPQQNPGRRRVSNASSTTSAGKTRSQRSSHTSNGSGSRGRGGVIPKLMGPPPGDKLPPLPTESVTEEQRREDSDW